MMQEEPREKDGFYVLKVIRYGIVLILILYTGLLLASKGDSRTPFAEVESAVGKAVGSGDMKKAGARELKRLYGLNAKDFEGLSLYYRPETMEVEEMLLVRVKKGQNTEAVVDAIMRRKETQIDNFDGYGAEQTKLLESSVVKTRGRYILFVVSPEAQSAEKAFSKSL